MKSEFVSRCESPTLCDSLKPVVDQVNESKGVSNSCVDSSNIILDSISRSMEEANEFEENQGPSSKETVDSEDETPESPNRRKMHSKEDKICRVCGDKALGYNFNAITCESCKAFFRRNAFKTVKCLFEDECLIDLRTRRFCPACRIKKCFSMGMNPQMILDDREKKKRLSKVVANRLKKRSTSKTNFTNIGSHLLAELQVEPDPELSKESFSFNSINSVSSEGRSFTPIGKPHNDRSVAIFKHPTPDLIPDDSKMFRQLTPDDQIRLNHITKAYQSTLASEPENGPHMKKEEYQRAADLINYSEHAVRNLIIFVKCLEEFRMMCQSDQISTLKSCIMHSLLLRSAVFYNIEKDAWITPKCDIPSSILKNATGYVDLHNSHVYYCRRVKSMMEDDIKLYALLQVLIVFDPSGSNISDRQFVSSVQDKYLILLKHYLESKFSYVFAKQYYVSAIDRLCDLKALSDEHSKILLMVKPVEVEPLMLEVLNLK